MHAKRWPGWVEVRRGRWLKIPPRQCPACGLAWDVLRNRPGERFIRCGCGQPFWHTLWTCPLCEASAAEGCADVGRWQNHTAPIEAEASRRWAVPGWTDT